MMNDNENLNPSPSFEIVEAEEEKLPKRRRIDKDKLIWGLSISFVILFSAFFGTSGGYFIYMTLHPQQEPNVIGSDTVLSDETVQKELKDGTLLTNYADKAYQILNYSFYKQASYPYSLTLTTGKTHALIADQMIQSATLVTPECEYYENISSGFTSTAYRFYDYNDGSNSLQSMMCSKTTDWETKTPESLSYDDYIQKFGKLYKGKYYVTYDTVDTTKAVPDIYLSKDEADYKAAVKAGKSAGSVTGVSIYNMNSKTVTGSSIEKIDTGYKVTVGLDVKKGACSYFKAQMKTTGGVDVKFVSSSITYELDEELNLVHGTTTDQYSTIGVTADQKLDIYYYHNNVESVFGNMMLTVPEKTSSQTFKGYDLLPKE